MSPSFESKEYWSNRFGTETEFEWLVKPEELVATILDVFEQLEAGRGDTAPSELSVDHDVMHSEADNGLNVLHIGCGSSRLIFHLLQNASIRKNIADGTVVNVDYAEEAIELGKREETKFWHKLKSEGEIHSPPRLRWVAADLLKLDDVKCLRSFSSGFGDGTFDLILDKSTCDAICCGADVEMQIPQSGRSLESVPMNARAISDGGQVTNDEPYIVKRPPLDVLAFNLAVVTRQGAIWAVISYSAERFPFLELLQPEQQASNSESEMQSMVDNRNPSRFWAVIKKAEIAVHPEEVEASSATVHRPKVTHWLYLLRRSSISAS